MKLTNITGKLSKLTGRTGLIFKKHSPEILLVVGITGTIVSAIMACKATLKANDILDEHKEKIDTIHIAWEKVKEGDVSLDEYSEKDHKKDLTLTYIQTWTKFIKLYGPAVSLGVASIACIVGGHGIMKKRNVALMAAYKAVEEGFNNYRQRVKDEHGEETDYMYKNGLKSEEFVEIEKTEDGKTKKVKKTRVVDDPNGLSVYARFFDESCSQWSKTPEYNLLFLKAQQTYFNQMLQARGHVFLNEVYEALGIPHSQAGAIVGWVIGDDGDNFIDFGIFDGDRERARAFVNGDERSIRLDFNVDGVIYDVFTKKKA